MHDALADPAEAQAEYGIEFCEMQNVKNCQAVILAVPHTQYLQLSVAEFGNMMDEGATLIDIKAVLNRDELKSAGLNVWRL